MNDKNLRSAVIVGLVGLGLASLFSARLLSESDWDVTTFVAFGENEVPIREYAEERLGKIHLRPEQGHDGKFFFVQANDPLLLEPSENAAILGNPRYRSQRMLYPLIAGLGGALSSPGIVWGLLVVNILALGLGSAVVALIATDMGGSPWWGLAFGLNLGLLSEMFVDGSGVVAALFAFLAVLALRRDRVGWIVVFLSLAGLAREVTLIAAIGLGFWLWRRARVREALLVTVVPAAVIAFWSLYVRWRVDAGSEVEGIDILGLPFQGIVNSIDDWVRDPISLVVGVLMILFMAFYTRRSLRSQHPVGWAFLGFVPMSLFLSALVWESWFDITRAIAPVLTSYVLLLALQDKSAVRPASRAQGINAP